MATVTPNFNWPVPTSTDLVKDGATAIEALGDSIDASLVDLKGGTSGQVLAKNSNTDMDFVWVTDAGGDITGVTAGTGISGGGTSGTVTVTNSMATAIDAKGDLIAGTGADAFSRLAVGTNGQVLTADSAEATGLKWAAAATSGGMTSIASGSLTGGSLALTGILGTYKNLQLVLRDVSLSTSATINWTANSITSYTALQQATASTTGTSVQHYSSVAGTAVPTQYDAWSSTGDGVLVLNLFDYANTTSEKVFESFAKFYSSSIGANQTCQVFGGINATAAITSLTFSLSTGTFSTGTYTLYGVN